MTEDTFLIDPRHQRFIDGESRRLYTGHRGALVAGLFTVPMGLFLGTFAAVDFEEGRALAERGRHAEGTVSSKRIEADDDSTSYHVDYTFRTERGEGVSSSCRVTQGRYSEVSEGDSIDVVYLPDDPKITRTKGREEPPLWVVFGVGLLFTAAGVFVLRYGILEYRRSLRLSRHGRVVGGVVLTSELLSDDDGSTIRLRYAFEDGGRRVEGTVGRSYARERNDVPQPHRRLAIVVAGEDHFVL